jgi:hypothetical protein
MQSHLVVVVAGALVLLATTAQAGVIQDRQGRQNARIEQGVASGALTPHEAGTLYKQQRVIARTRDRALADGVVSPSEARQLTREQNHASQDIYDLKHNDRTW